MAAAGTASPALPMGQASLDNDDSNVSSPLSDVEDGDGDDVSLDGMHLNRSSPQPQPADDSDSESNLSEANDTEAETERLYDTPQAQRQKDVVVSRYNDNDQDNDNENEIYEHTPSKLNKTYSIEDDGADADDDSLSDNDDVSMASSHPGDDEDEEEEEPSPIKKSTEVPAIDDSQDSIDSKKRKRSPAAEQSDTDQPLRKRTGSVAAPKEAASVQATPTVEEDEDDDDDALSTHPNSGEHSGPEDLGAEIPTIEPLRDSESPVKDAHPSKKLTRPGSKSRSDDGEEVADHGADKHEEGTVDEEADHAADDEPADDEPAEPEDDADAATRNAEELERKQAALEEWNELESKFGLFRDRLYKERLDKLEAEEQSLQAESPTHLEYLLMKACLDDRLEKKLAEINKEHELTLEALDRVAIARRSQIWGQFYQGVREKREHFLERLNSDWYDTQNARRSAHSVPDYGLQFPANPAQRTRNAVAYNTEVSHLSGLAKHEGFPAVPDMRGASLAEMEEDFAAFKRDAKTPHRNAAQPSEDVQPVAGYDSGLGTAGEQFIKNTPWANPNHASHKMQHVPLQSDSGPSGAIPPPKVAAAAGPARKNGQSMPRHSPTALDASPETLRTATMLSQGVVNRKRNGSLVGRGSKAPQDTAPKADSAVAVS